MEVVELDRSDAAELLALYREYGWWADRSRGAVERALSNTSLALGIRDAPRTDGQDGEHGELIAEARVLTDFTYYARVYDVVVAEDRRGEGVGERLVDAVTTHPALAGTNVVLLCREGLVEFYQSCGFEPYPDAVEVPEGGRQELCQLYYRLNTTSADDG